MAKTVWYTEKRNLCPIWNVEEIRAIGLPVHQYKVTIFVVSSKAPTAQAIHASDYSRRLDLFETACRVFAIPMQVKHCLEPSAIFLVVQGDILLLDLRLDEESDEETSKGVSAISGEIWPKAIIAMG